MQTSPFLSYSRGLKFHPNQTDVEELPLRVFGVVGDSIVDGPELRYVIFVQGCPHHCKGCHNPGSHSPDGGKLTTTSKIWSRITANPLLKGVTFSGGEPFLWGWELAVIGRAAREAGLTVMTYSGWTYEALLEKAKVESGVHELLACTNYLVDGPYVEAMRDLTLRYRGSSNQKIRDITCYPNTVDAEIMDWDLHA